MTDNIHGRRAVHLTDPNAGPFQVIADGGLDLTMRVSTKEFEYGWDQLGKIMDADPSYRRRDWIADGHTEEELRHLCGLFCAVANALPMNASNFIEWLRVFEAGSGAVDGFVIWRMRQLDDEALAEVLRDRNLDALGLEHIDDPVLAGRNHRGPGKVRKPIKKAD